jgi:thioredoxin:protein disulfide reductase
MSPAQGRSLLPSAHPMDALASMPRRRPQGLLLWALAAALALLLLPLLLPAGPTSSLDAAGYLGKGRFFAGALVVFLGGLLTALTPCVYPLVPITVSVFGARGATTRPRAFLLTSAYVVGMGLVFSALGVAAARTGAAFGAVLGKPLVVLCLAAVLLLLAASMFGAFELALPSGLVQRLSGVGGAGVAGALLMGSVAGFLAAPCTGPVLTGLLAFVAKSQDTVLGAGLLFIYALGIGVPFFLIGAFAVQLPKGGVWMEWVKSLLGVLLVALAATYVKDAFPALREAVHGVALALGRVPGVALAAGLAAAGVLLGAIHRSFGAGPREAFLKGTGVALLCLAVLLRAGTLDAPAAKDTVLRWELTWAGEPSGPASPVDRALASARASGKPVMIDFFAEWCAACKELDRATYVAPQVVAESERFVRIKVDGTNGQDALDALYQRFGIEGLPTVAFVSSRGEILEHPRVMGFLGPEEFLEEMRRVR